MMRLKFNLLFSTFFLVFMHTQNSHTDYTATTGRVIFFLQLCQLISEIAATMCFMMKFL